jgi:hypothetical protein
MIIGTSEDVGLEVTANLSSELVRVRVYKPAGDPANRELQSTFNLNGAELAVFIEALKQEGKKMS